MTNFQNNWVFDRILALDEARPGFAGFYLRGSNERRHVIAAFLSSDATGLSSLSEKASLLAAGTHNEILTAAYGSVPEGLRSTLGRVTPDIQQRKFYGYLYRLLTCSESKAIFAVLAAQKHIDLTRLRVMRTLPPAIRSPRLVWMHRDVKHARNTNALFNLMSENGANLIELSQSLRAVETAGALRRCWQRWIEKLHFPEPPIPASVRYQPVETAHELRSIALAYRNCLRRYLTDVLDGQDAFGVFTTSTQEVLIHFRRREGFWTYEGCHARCNGPVQGEVKRAANDFAEDNGIYEFKPKKATPSKWEPLRDAICRWDLETHFDEWG